MSMTYESKTNPKIKIQNHKYVGHVVTVANNMLLELEGQGHVVKRAPD